MPRRPADLTTGWLTEALCQDVPLARVLAIDRPGRASSGTTTRAALSVAYNEAGAHLPRHLFVKCTSSLPQRLMLGAGGLIGGEPGFYEQLRPDLEIEAPEGYFASVDPASWRSIVIAEDVSRTRGAQFWAPGRRLARDQIEQLLSEVATWHGALWESRSLDACAWLRSTADQGRLIESLITLADRTSAGAARAQSVIPPGLRSRQTELFRGMLASMQAAAASPHTYLHGDLHVANTYVTDAGRVGVCDWQVGLRGCWAQDVGYLLATALDVEERRAWERDLLAVYLERLNAAGGVAPPAPEAWTAYRRSLLYPYFAWIYTLGRSRLQPHFQPSEVALSLIRRIATAIEDLDSLRAVGISTR